MIHGQKILIVGGTYASGSTIVVDGATSC